MTSSQDFELELASALRAYVAEAPTRIEPSAYVRALAARRAALGRQGTLPGLRRGYAWALLAGLVAIALVAIAIVGYGGRPSVLVDPSPFASPSNSPSNSPSPSPEPSAPPGVAGPIQITWYKHIRGIAYQNGEQVMWVCPPNGPPDAGSPENVGVWGTDTYSDDSWICRAAVHAGLITFEGGGPVTIEIRPGLETYVGSTRNGVTTASYGSWHRSYVFVP